MADIVELMDFWPMDDDENIGFVAADSDFQLWLIAGIGVGFEDISYSVIDGPDDSGIYELIMDYDDYINLQDLYSEYLETGWAGLEEEDFDEVFAMNNEEGSTPVMDPMEFGEPVNWTPMDGTPSLKRRKDAETHGHGDSSSYVTINWHWEMTHPDDYGPDEWNINEQIEQAVREGESGWYSFEDDEGHTVEAFIYDPSFGAEGINYAAEGSGEIDISPVYVEKKVPVLWKHDYATKDYEWSTDEPTYLTDDQEYELVEIVEQIVEDSDEEEGDESFDEDDYKGEVTWNTYMDDGRFYDLGAEGKGSEKEKKLWVVTAMADELIWEEGNQFDTTVRVFDNLINAKKYFNELLLMNGYTEEELDSPEDHWDYSGAAIPQPMDDGDKLWIEFAIKELSMGYDNGEVYSAEGANPSGGATGDQIISWEHNGLSSPSGPPSDIFWSEDFDAQMGHSRFQKSDNPRRDMSDTRRRLKQEMFSDVSGVFTLKNMAVLGLAGITGYLIAGRN